MQHSVNRTTGVWLIIAAAVMWSSGGVLVKTLTGSFGLQPQVLACLRSLAAGLVLCWALPRLPGASWRRVGPAAVLYTALVFTFVASTTKTSAANAIFLEYFSPLLVAVGAYALGTDRPRLGTLLSLLIGMAGVVVIIYGSWGPNDLPGVWLGLACALAGAVFTLVQRGINTGSSVGIISLYNLVAAAAIFPFAYKAMGNVTIGAIVVVCLMGTFQLGIPFVFFIRGLRVVPVVEASLLTLLEPVLNPIWVWIFRGEKPTAWTVAGGSAILAALVVHIVTQRAPEAQPVGLAVAATDAR